MSVTTPPDDWAAILLDALEEGVTLHAADGSLLAGNSAARRALQEDPDAEVDVARCAAAVAAGESPQPAGERVADVRRVEYEGEVLVVVRWAAARATGAPAEPRTEPVAQDAVRPAPALEGRSVLLVEDDPVSRTVVQRMLELLGARCVATDPGAVTDTGSGDGFDALVVGVRASEADGLQVVERLRGAGSGTVTGARGRRTPLVAMTSDPSPEVTQACRAAGADVVVGKPVSSQALLEHVEHLLGLPDPGVEPPTEPTEPLVDPQVLRDLEDQLGDPLIVRDTVRMYLGELDPRSLDIIRAAGELRREDLRGLAHSLKSASAMLGVTALAAACLELEREAAEADEAWLLARVTELAPLVAESAAQLRRTVPDVGS